jgi:hypothetical protein
VFFFIELSPDTELQASQPSPMSLSFFLLQIRRVPIPRVVLLSCSPHSCLPITPDASHQLTCSRSPLSQCPYPLCRLPPSPPSAPPQACRRTIGRGRGFRALAREVWGQGHGAQRQESYVHAAYGARQRSRDQLMRTSHLLIHPLHLQRNTYKDLSLELVPSNLTIMYFCFLELFLTYMRI